MFAAKQTSKAWIFEKQAESKEWVKRRQQSLAREILFLEMIKSPHVIGFVELILTKSNYYCILEYANGGSVQTLLNLHQRFPEKVSKKILKQIIEGCTAMFDSQVMHRDLKLDNILIHFPDRDNNKKITDEELKAIDLSTEKFIVKIADLGFAREIDDDAKKRRFTYVGSPLLMPPEQLITRWQDDTEVYDYKIDVWALGGIFYQMMTGLFIFLPTEKTSYDMALRNLNKMI